MVVVTAAVVHTGAPWWPFGPWRRNGPQSADKPAAVHHPLAGADADSARPDAAQTPGDASGVSDMIRLLDAVARSLRAGNGVHDSLRAATAVAGVHRHDLTAVTTQLDGGSTLVAALASWRFRCPNPPVALATAVLTFGVHTGGSIARGVDAAASTLRERLALHGEVRVMAAQARASAMVVAAVPFGFTVVVAMADPRVPGFLLTTVPGVVCVVAGVGLEIACFLWMRALVASAGSL